MGQPDGVKAVIPRPSKNVICFGPENTAFMHVTQFSLPILFNAVFAYFSDDKCFLFIFFIHKRNNNLYIFVSLPYTLSVSYMYICIKITTHN